MLKPSQVLLLNSALETFRSVRDTYERMCAISSVDLYYDGYNTTRHGNISSGNETSRVAKAALVEYWWRKLQLELSNLLTHGIDASEEMPQEPKNDHAKFFIRHTAPR